MPVVAYFLATIIRVFLAVSTRTFFQPDEHFQSLEIAHLVAYGYGHRTWEWRLQTPIRSPIFPFLWVPLYKALSILQLEDTFLLISGPKLLTGAFACITDLFIPALAKKILGQRYTSVPLLLSLLSFFNGLSLVRSMSNSLETSLTTVGLALWPWDTSVPTDSRAVRTSTILAALACIVRPTNAVLWFYLYGLLMWRMRQNRALLRQVLLETSLIGTAALFLLFSIDSIFYRKLTFTPANFIRANASPISLFFGTNPWHFYFTQALPLICFTALPYCLHGMLLASRSGLPAERDALGLIIWVIGIYSGSGHKEWRFIHPILPLLLVFGAKSLVLRYESRVSKSRGRGSRGAYALPIRWLDLALLSLAVPALIYTNFFHSSAQISVMHYLRSLPSDELVSVGFIMPCHSTPWQAYLHRKELAAVGQMWALGCEPPLGGQSLEVYRDQTDIFYSAPVNYFNTHFPIEVSKTYPPSPHPITTPGSLVESHTWQHEWPSHLVLFQELLSRRDEEGGETVQELLARKGYSCAWSAPGFGEEDPRRRGGVAVWRH